MDDKKGKRVSEITQEVDLLQYEVMSHATFSLSVPISFLSSLFFSFPGASAMGKEV